MSTLSRPAAPLAPVSDALRTQGYVHLPAPALQQMLGWGDEAWRDFAASWDRLGPDGFMADGGRYRLRRHATFAAHGPQARRQPHQPHYQSRDYNPLNGGVQRWFEPMEEGMGASPVLDAVFAGLTPLFAALDGRAPAAPWHSEVHQFRIETSARETGRPTPEGFHRDGVDWVLVMLMGRRNVEEGTTEIAGLDGQALGRFTLCQPGDAVLLDDRRILHGVTPIRPLSLSQAAHRDALVVTWRAGDMSGDDGLQQP
jgi:hypothetical protein